MKQILVAVLALMFSGAGFAQDQKTPVSVGHTGKDEVGSLFVGAFNRQLSHSARYEPMKGLETGFRFYVSFVTLDPSDNSPEQGRRSVVSVVIEDMGRPNSLPVAEMWYHKVVVVKRQTVDETAKQLLEDMDARWCRTIRNATGGCPAEKFDPRAP